MADNITAPATGEVFATDDIGGIQYPRTKIGFGVDGSYVDVSSGAPLPVTLGLTDAQLRATAVPVSLAPDTDLIGDVGQQYRANATGAGTLVNLNCPATPAVQTIKGSAGRLIGIYLVNTNATIRWLKVFNATAPTLASTAAALRIPLPQNQPVFISFEGGMAFDTAITCAITSSGALNLATGAVTLDDVTGFAVFA